MTKTVEECFIHELMVYLNKVKKDCEKNLLEGYAYSFEEYQFIRGQLTVIQTVEKEVERLLQQFFNTSKF